MGTIYKNMNIQKSLPIIFFSAFYILLLVTVLYFGWLKGWSLFFVHTLSKPFGDMRTIQGAIISMNLGLDPYIENPGDPWNRTVNYPPVWIYLGKMFALDAETNLIAFVLTFETFFLCCIGYFIFRFPSWTIALVAVSGAILMGIERGNNDLLIFSIIFLALMSQGTLSRAFFILIASVLKLYPIISCVSLLTTENSNQQFI